MADFFDFILKWFNIFNVLFKRAWHFVDDNKGLFEEEEEEAKD